MPQICAPQGQHNWWTKRLGGSRKTLRNWTGGWAIAKSVAQEGRKVKPILPPSPYLITDRKTSRTDQTGLKSEEEFFSLPTKFLLPFCPSFFFYSFFLPSFTYLFILISVEIPSYFSSDLFLFLLASSHRSFLSFLFSSFFNSVPSYFFSSFSFSNR